MKKIETNVLQEDGIRIGVISVAQRLGLRGVVHYQLNVRTVARVSLEVELKVELCMASLFVHPTKN